MAYELITKKRFNAKVLNVLAYLKLNWSKEVAENFVFILEKRLEHLSIVPFSGSKVGLKDVISILITKHNRL